MSSSPSATTAPTPASSPSPAPTPLVSVVIPCYNHAAYLPQAVESVQAQSTDVPLEILVIDDGSTDDTAHVSAQLPFVRYHWQPNAGLSAARNAGLRRARGRYVLFVDADDWLLPGALHAALSAAEAHPDAAFVAGAHEVHVTDDAPDAPCNRRARRTGRDLRTPTFGVDPYATLLRRNVVEMHAAVLYQREALERVGGFDPGLAAAEDYDVFLRLARIHPIVAHAAPIAAYRKHAGNMSNDPARMLSASLTVLRRHQSHVADHPERASALEAGLNYYRSYYGTMIVQRLRHLASSPDARTDALRTTQTLLQEAPSWTASQVGTRLGEQVRTAVPWSVKRTLRRVLGRREPTPPPGSVDFGDFRRTAPISRHFGYDRGRPVDRFYIEGFLDAHRTDVQGRVLEIGERVYTERFGDDRVTQSDVLHVYEGNPEATFVGDLTDAPHLPSDAFDCIILTQTLQLIYDVPAALRTLRRILAPGGVLLLTVPGITPNPDGVQGEGWFWSFTERSVGALLAEAFADDTVALETHGNVLVATALLQGLAQSELTQDELEIRDPAYPVTIAGRIVRAR